MGLIIGILAIVVVIAIVIYNSSCYLLDLQEQRDKAKFEKKIRDIHYKYALERYGINTQMWKRHQVVCLYGCSKR